LASPGVWSSSGLRSHWKAASAAVAQTPSEVELTGPNATKVEGIDIN
jgi:hypothetical protein